MTQTNLTLQHCIPQNKIFFFDFCHSFLTGSIKSFLKCHLEQIKKVQKIQECLELNEASKTTSWCENWLYTEHKLTSFKAYKFTTLYTVQVSWDKNKKDRKGECNANVSRKMYKHVSGKSK